jgi:hypothetical protein
MKHMGVLLLLPLSGCLLLALDSKKQDGESCDSASDCESDQCMGAICVGTSCSSSSDCADNFRCYHYDGDPIFDIGDHDACRLACDAQRQCPAQWTCGNGDTYCTYVGPTVTVTVSNSQPRAHEVVTFSGTIDPPVSGITWTWTFYDPVVAGNVLEKKTGASIERVFDAGDWNWTVDAMGDGGSQHYESGFIHACAVVGDACSAYSPCCDQTTCNYSTMTCE